MGNRICGCRTSRSIVEDRLTRPQRLIQQPYNIDYRKLRKHILSRKLAPCFDADDEPDSDLEECPICFLYFPSLNRSQCCTKEICTECFLQIGLSSSATRVRCPFCKNSNYAVEYCGAKTKEEKALELMEEQKVMEAKLRMQYGNSCGLNHVEPALEVPVPPLEAHCPTEGLRFNEEFDPDLEGLVIMKPSSNL